MKKSLNKICEDLDLKYFSVEWGVTNSDKERISEFIDYYLNSPFEDKDLDYLELVLNSANQGLLYDSVDRKSFFKLINFIENYPELYDNYVITYWLSLDDFNEFPLTPILRALKC